MKANRSVLALALSLALGSAASAAVETYQIDPVHSTVGFSLRHLVSKFSGSFSKVTGTIVVDRDNLEKSSVEAAVDVGSINTADEKRNGHLKNDDFFSFARFPTMTFKGAAWKKVATDTFDVTGDLTVKDITKPVTFRVTLLGFGPGMGGAQVSGWEATTKIKKSEFGLGGPAMLGKALGDEVTLNIGIEAVMKK
jgi:polyisoprenoid-binding protein YceI